ncbi:MAG: T9SS type A sorting domain-containing protein [Candidatus Krumholzibacteriota bacterium]|nr:T9SS type A sorting domain-containing protein [Candidatus Krumholzibacteriota bacterium]
MTILAALALAATSAPPAAADPVRVEFRFQRADAPIVNLAGTFNGWCDAYYGVIDTGIDPMNGPDAGGWWTLEKLLDPGVCEYKFVVNGNTWYTDPLNPRVDHQDNNNSILAVSDPLVYYVLPRDGSLVTTATPVIEATLARSDAAAFDLSTLAIHLDGELVAGGPAAYDPATRRAAFAADSLDAGGHDARVAVALVGGAAHADSTAFTIFVDFVPPAIAHAPPAAVTAGERVPIEAVITDDLGVESALLNYRNAGDPDFAAAAMAEGLDDVWAAAIPAGFTRAGSDLEYCLEASDLSNTTRLPVAGFFAVPVAADDAAPAITDAFASPPTFDPDGEDDATRLSFRLSEPAVVTVTVTTAGGAPVRTLLDGAPAGASYVQAVWDGASDLGADVPDGGYVFHVAALDGAGNPSGETAVPIVVDRGAPPEPIDVILLFHANQTLNYQGDTANDACFWGLVEVLRRHPQSRFMLHFSGTLLHDLGWFNFRHEPSTLDMLRAGAADGQFEIVGSTYAQNVPYGTAMWDNARQVEVHREVIGAMLGAEPVSFWNPERCWKQGLVELMAGNGYAATWVETHILEDSGMQAPEHAVRRTAFGGHELIVFNDDQQMLGFDGAVDSGDATNIINYLAWLRGQDTWRDFAACYCQDAEATGLWDYENGGDPAQDWAGLDQVLTAMEATGWIRFTTMSEYLAEHRPTEMLEPIVDGQALWMIGPSQQAGYADWFDFQARDPAVLTYRDFYAGLRGRIESVGALAPPDTPAARLVEHAVRNFVAHQFEFACIGCGGIGCQDWHKAETLEGALLAAEAALAPPPGVAIANRDANGDGVADWTLATPADFFILSETGGRLLRWFDLEHGEEILGNELFMRGFYYEGWREWYAGPGWNDDRHYQEDAVWDAWNLRPAVMPYHREYAVRKHALNDRLTIDGGGDATILDAEYSAAVQGDALVLACAAGGLAVTKTFAAAGGGISVTYDFENTSGAPHACALTIESELNPSLLAIMDNGRGSVAYWDGADTSSVITPGAVGVRNTVTGRTAVFGFSEPPASVAGGETVHGLLFSPTFAFALAPGGTKQLTLALGVATTGVDPGGGAPPPFRLGPSYPNPFNPLTTIGFTLPAAGPVELAVYDVAGRRVATLVDRPLAAGAHRETWGGTDDSGRRVASGVYLLRLSAGGRTATRKAVLLK